MKKIRLAIIIILVITVIGMTTGLSFAWFSSAEKTDSTILHQSNSPLANVVVENIVQTGTLAPAVPYVNSVGVPSYISDPNSFNAYVANEENLLTANGTIIDEAAESIQITGKFKYEGKDDDGLNIGNRTLVVQVLAENHDTTASIDMAHFAYNFEADDDNDTQTPAAISKVNSKRTTYGIYTNVLTISVVPAALETDWYWFTLTVYFSEIDDYLDTSLNGLAIDFTLNIIAA